MELWQALLLGLIEGLTEYLPVSSTAHLLIAQRWLGIESSAAANAYAIVIQAGAIVAVLGLYRRRVGEIVLGVVGRHESGRRLLLGLLVAFVPAAIIGFVFDKPIERVLFGPWPIVVAWSIGGILLLVISPRLRARPGYALEQLRPSAALWIGLAQCAALWPGVSRSMATILGGIAVGLSLGSAVEFSFLLGLLTLGAATSYKALSSGALLLHTYGWPPLIVGFLSAWVAAVLAVRWMVNWLNQRGLGVFGWWRLIAAALVTMWLLRGPPPVPANSAPGDPLTRDPLTRDPLIRDAALRSGSS
ncbi:MAG: undecaprenyl-diphosphate phosphatase [Deltaproteobacteria bacterium]